MYRQLLDNQLVESCRIFVERLLAPHDPRAKRPVPHNITTLGTSNFLEAASSLIHPSLPGQLPIPVS
jgi:hypothetical protein